jgi:hypothetical protein
VLVRRATGDIFTVIVPNQSGGATVGDLTPGAAVTAQWSADRNRIVRDEAA